MVSARINVAAPSFTHAPFGLMSVVEWRDGDPHWQAGVQWENVCGNTTTTFDECVLANAVTGSAVLGPEPTPKAATAFKSTFGATPFTVYAEVDCSAVGFYPDSTDWALQALLENESYELERVFWTGIVDGNPNYALPHLAALTEIVVSDPSVSAHETILQQATTVVTGGTTPEIALGLLEAAFADCFRGVGIVHAPLNVITLLAEAFLLTRVGDRYQTPNGNWIVSGGGYPGTGPAGTGTTWMYITPPIFGYRSEIRTFNRESTLDRGVNTVRAVAERNYLLAYDCCLLAISVSTT